MLTTLEKVDILRKAALFGEIPTESLARLAAVTQETSFQAREALFQENAPAGALFVLVEGQVDLRRGGKHIQTQGAFRAVGALPLLAEQPYPDSAVASQLVRALRIERHELSEAMSEDFSITRGILRTLSRLAAGPDQLSSL